MNSSSKTLCLLAAPIFLFSWPWSKFNSMDEAFTAQRKFLRQGKDIVVIYIPTDDDIERKKEEAFDESTRRFLVWNTDTPPHLPPIPVPTKENLTTRTVESTRSCFHEHETRQYVCKEKKVRGDEIAREDWNELKPTYSYFRY